MTFAWRRLLSIFGLIMLSGAAIAAPQMTLILQQDRLSVARLDAQAPVPNWAANAPGFSSISRTGSELSIVCAAARLPADVKQETGFRLLRVDGSLDFALVGILASITAPLAKAGVSIFVVSTYDTDYVMVKDDKLEQALAALRAAGHKVKID